jgi:hypothetical protein
MEYPTLAEFMATHHGPEKRLLNMALAKLTTTGEYWNSTPDEVWAELIEMAEDIYEDESA